MRCREGIHQAEAAYVPGCGLGLWVANDSYVELLIARCRICRCMLVGLSWQAQLESWAPMIELFGRPHQPHSHSLHVKG
jgi:hypothetical protein